jgi:hypothetical protein
MRVLRLTPQTLKYLIFGFAKVSFEVTGATDFLVVRARNLIMLMTEVWHTRAVPRLDWSWSSTGR